MNKGLKACLIASALASALCASALAAPFSLNSSPSQVLATVSVAGTTELITKGDLDEKVAEYRSLGMTDTEDEILDVLVNDKVFLMSAQRDGIAVTDAEVSERIRQTRSQIEVQLGRPLSDEEFNSYALSSAPGMSSMDEYREELRKVMLVDKYVRSQKGVEFDRAPLISDSEVSAFYRRNRTQFTNPEYVRVSHIFVRKTDDAVENGRKLEKMRSTLRDIQSGALAFERAVSQYSEDSDSVPRGGDIGSVTESATDVLGEHFVDVCFTLEPGDIAQEVVESTQGYHIVKATAHADPKFLDIDDYISPDSNVTVREYVRSYLQQQKAQDDYAETVNAFVDELKRSARISYTNRSGS